MKIRVHVQDNFVARDVDLFVLMERPASDDALLVGVEWKTLDQRQKPEPDAGRPFGFGVRHRDLLQAMLDAAWDHGMRPSGYSDVAEAMKASDAHLQDMRAIAFHKIGAPKP